MNGALTKVGVDQLALGLLATAAVAGVLTDSGVAFWAAWHGLAVLGFLSVRWRRRPAVAVD